ncbi:MAG: Asd/ArgC dimerization domain-containing protein [Acidobacteriota bacterium]
MTTLAILHPTHLVATELRETLEQRRELWRSLRLLTTDEEEAGTLLEARGEATVVAQVEDGAFDGVDVALFFGHPDTYRALLDDLPASTRAIVVAGDAADVPGRPWLSGLSAEHGAIDGPILHPHPAAIAVAHLLHPLRQLGLVRASATILEPTSVYGKAGLDELLDQTRDILSFQGRAERDVLPAQLAFNVLQPPGRSAGIEAQARAVLGADDLPLSVQRLSAGVFHGYGVSLHGEIDPDRVDGDLATVVAETLETHSVLDFAVDPELLGPVDVAARDEILVAEVRADAFVPGGFTLWAVMDNLTVGGSTNLIALIEGLTGTAAG